MQEVLVELKDGVVEKALHDTGIMQPLVIGDEVLLNTTAMELGLGTGGYHFVHAVLRKANPEGRAVSRTAPVKARSFVAGKVRRPAGHMMKMKYTSLQRPILAVEEAGSPYHHLFAQPMDLGGVPILIGELHSMLPIAAAWIHQTDPQLRIAYVMSDGGALPISLSKHASALKQLAWICGTVTYGQAYGGDLEAMNKFTGLLAAKHILHADIVIVCMGPGIAGTGTPLGHTGTEVGELINAVSLLKGIPIMVPRVSGVDQRDRHYGISHHVISNLMWTTACAAVVPMSNQLSVEVRNHCRQQLNSLSQRDLHQIVWMKGVELPQLQAALQSYPQKITTMGRGLDRDPSFFLSVACAAQYALQCISK